MGMKVGIKSGSHVIIHAGHIWCLEQCKKQVDHLIVLLNDDEYVMKKKGIVPIDLADRMKIIGSLKMVDEVDWFSGDTEDEWIRIFKEEKFYQEFGKDSKLIVFHSIETKTKSFIPGAEYADQIIFIPRISGSTTEIFKDIKENEKK